MFSSLKKGTFLCITLYLYYNKIMGIRDYKNFTLGEHYHIFNRGVGRMKIFRNNQDYGVFLSRMRENLFPNLKLKLEEGALLGGKKRYIYTRKSLPKGAFSLIAYCLMPNHFHLLIKQNTDIPISKLLLKICSSYSIYFNKKYNRVGSLFQDQFKAEIVNKNEYLIWLSAYIHLNPRVANIASDSLSWEWSSYPEYLKLSENRLCEKNIILDQFESLKNYQKNVENSYESIKSKKEPLLDILNVEFEFK